MSFVNVGAGKVVLFVGENKTTFTHTVKPCEVLKVTKAVASCVNYILECTICGLVKCQTVQHVW